jgi:hypothetical protein
VVVAADSQVGFLEIRLMLLVKVVALVVGEEWVQHQRLTQVYIQVFLLLCLHQVARVTHHLSLHHKVILAVLHQLMLILAVGEEEVGVLLDKQVAHQKVVMADLDIQIVYLVR